MTSRYKAIDLRKNCHDFSFCIQEDGSAQLQLELFKTTSIHREKQLKAQSLQPSECSHYLAQALNALH